jgi:hypothetical protein
VSQRNHWGSNFPSRQAAVPALWQRGNLFVNSGDCFGEKTSVFQ